MTTVATSAREPRPDDDRSWGSFDAEVSWYGVRHYRLTIFPPGTSLADRCLARLWRAWPIGGAALMVLAAMLLGQTVSAGTVLLSAGGGYAAVGSLLFACGGPRRVPVRSMTVVVMPRSTDLQALCRYTYWRALVDMLTGADARLAAGAISAPQHRAVWCEAYARLGEWSRAGVDGH